MPTFDLSPLAKGIGVALLGLLAAGAIWAAVWFVFERPHALKAQAAQATASSISAQATTKSAQDALKITVDTQALHGRIDVMTKENTDAIRNAPGASAEVDMAAHGAGLRALCMYDAYRGSETCRQLLDAGPPSTP